MGIAVAIITLLFTLIVADGFLEYSRWRKLIEEVQKSVKLAEESAKKAEEAAENAKKKEDDLNKIRKSAEDEINKIRSQISLQFLPEVSGEESKRDIIPKEIKEKLEDLTRKIELYEALGFQLRPEDYLYRGINFYDEGKYDLPIQSFNKALELNHDYPEAWYNKGRTLKELGKYEEAIKSHDKAIVIKPDYAEP